MFLKFTFGNSALIIALSLGLVAATAVAQTPQPDRQMPNMKLPKLSFPNGKNVVVVPFEVEGNWMVVPISINGSRPLRFVLDTGAQGTFLNNSEISGSLNLKIVGKMPIRGAGGAGGEASVAEDVTFNIGGIELSNARLVVSPPPQPGMKFMGGRDGAIGRIVFATLVVEVDWEKQVLKFYDPSKYKYSGLGKVLPLTFDEGGRPYTVASVAVWDDKSIPVKLVVDTGGSHSLSLDVGSNPEIKLPEGATKTVLGRGAGGEITGSTGRIKKFQLGGQTIEDVPTIFPDSNSGITGIGGRQGSLGAGLLRRFKIIYDYSRNQMIVEPNKFFGEPFAAAPTIVAGGGNTNISPSALQDYVGRFGERTITVEDNSLNLQRQGGAKIKLVAASKDEFTIERIPTARIKFVRDETGKVMEIEVLNREGVWEKSKKEMSNQPIDQPQDNRELSPAEREVRKLEREWLDAYEKRDAEAMNRILSDDFKLASNGSVQTKADVLAQLKSVQDPGQPSPKFSTEDVQSRVEGDTVILTGRFIQTLERGGQMRTMQMRYVDKYAKRQGRWQVVASQLTPIQSQ